MTEDLMVKRNHRTRRVWKTTYTCPNTITYIFTHKITVHLTNKFILSVILKYSIFKDHKITPCWVRSLNVRYFWK